MCTPKSTKRLTDAAFNLAHLSSQQGQEKSSLTKITRVFVCRLGQSVADTKRKMESSPFFSLGASLTVVVP